jgi:flagellar hook-length control protein FliK
MAIQLATTDSHSRVSGAAGAAAAPVASEVATNSPFDLLLIAPADVGPVEMTKPVVEVNEAEAEEVDQNESAATAQAIVAPVVILPMLPPDAVTLDAPMLNAHTLDTHAELPQEFVRSITAEAAAVPLAFAADGKPAAESNTTPAMSPFPAQEPAADGSTDALSDSSNGANVPAVADAADGLARPAESHSAAEFDIDQSRDLEQADGRDSLSDQLSSPAAELPPAGPPTATATPVDPPPTAASPPLGNLLALQPSILPQVTRAESQPVASSQPPTSESSPIDAARLLHRVARAFAAAKDGGEVRLRLSPPELGALTLDVRVHEGTLVARLEAETTSVRTVLVENLPALRDRLAEQGIRIERFDVDLRQPGGGGSDWSAHQPFQESSSREQPARERRLPQVAEGVNARTTRVPAHDPLSHDLRRLNVIV